MRRLVFIILGLVAFACIGLFAIALLISPSTNEQAGTGSTPLATSVEQEASLETQPRLSTTDDPSDGADVVLATSPSISHESAAGTTDTVDIATDYGSTSTPTATATKTPTPIPIGRSRSAPYSRDDLVESPNWDVQVMDVVRGNEAWSLLQSANQFNDPAPLGTEYILVRLSVKSKHGDNSAHRISDADFKVTGDGLIQYSAASVVSPEPELGADLYSGGIAEGWAVYNVAEDEKNLILVVDELLNFDSNRLRYIALDDGASVSIDPSLATLLPTDRGTSREAPAAIGEILTTEDFELTVVEILHDEEAWAAIQRANSYNEPPGTDRKYSAVRIRVRNIRPLDEALPISEFDFQLTGSENVLYDNPSIIDPVPRLSATLYPGGVFEGWLVVESGRDETDLMLVFKPPFLAPNSETRYLALVDNASVQVPTDLASITPNDEGTGRSSPAPFGDTVTTADWELAILEVVRGQEAWQMAQEANQFNDAPDPGLEYVTIFIRVRNISTDQVPKYISRLNFRTVGSNNIEYGVPSVVEPRPRLDVKLYPGGQYEGWITMQSATDDDDLLLVFDPSFSSDRRYLSLTK